MDSNIFDIINPNRKKGHTEGWKGGTARPGPYRFILHELRRFWRSVMPGV